MKVTIVSCVFPPEPVVSGRTSLDIARESRARGHAVTVLAPFPSRPAGYLYPGFSRRLYRRESAAEGYALIRCFSTLSRRSRLPSRLLENLTFGLTSAAAVLFLPRPDVIYVNTWPIVAGGLVFLAAKARRIPLVLSVQDVYPESLVSQGRTLAGKLSAGVLRRWDGLVARGSRALIVISPRFARLYAEGRRVPRERIHVVPNWGDDGAAPADAGRIAGFRREKGIPEGARVFAYGGNIGVAAGVETLVEAARILDATEGFRLLIAGSGSQYQACRELAREGTGERVVFHSPWPAEETDVVLGAAEVLLVPTRGRQSGFSVPSKLISYWLAGKPVIAMALPQSDLAEMIELSGGGWLVEPDRPDLLAARMVEVLQADRGELRRRGLAGRDFAQKNLTRSHCLPRVIGVLEGAGIR